jgi:hypothetical protein
MSRIQTRSQKQLPNKTNISHNIKCNNVSNSKSYTRKLRDIPSNLNKQYSNENKWLNDSIIQEYYNDLSNNISTFRDDVLLFGPATSMLLKSAKFYDVLTTLSALSFEKINIAFFCVNNHIENEEYENDKEVLYRGTHWSLLIFDRFNKTFYHYDSMRPLNNKHAQTLAKSVSPNYPILEMNTIQQSNNFECGLHLLVNTKVALDNLVIRGRCVLNELSISSKTSFNVSHNDTADLHNYFLNESLEPPKTHFCDEVKTNTSTLSHLDAESTNNEPKFKLYRPNSKKKRSKTVSRSNNNNFVLPCSNKYSVLSEEGLKDIKANETHVDSTNIFSSSDQNIKTTQQIPNKNSCTDLNLTKRSCGKKFKIKLIADSHGRGVRNLMSNRFDHLNDVSACIKPNAKVHAVLDNIENEVQALTNRDFIIIAAGTNDITSYMNDQSYIASNLEDKIKIYSHTNIIVTALPYRYDKPWLNIKIRGINKQIERFCERYNHTNFLSLYNINRDDYTTHGLHLNKIGKMKYVNSLYNVIAKIECLNNNEAKIPIRITQRNHFLGNHPLMAMQH